MKAWDLNCDELSFLESQAVGPYYFYWNSSYKAHQHHTIRQKVYTPISAKPAIIDSDASPWFSTALVNAMYRCFCRSSILLATLRLWEKNLAMEYDTSRWWCGYPLGGWQIEAMIIGKDRIVVPSCSPTGQYRGLNHSLSARNYPTLQLRSLRAELRRISIRI